MTASGVDALAAEMRRVWQREQNVQPGEPLSSQIHEHGPWFQRVVLPGGYTTTSDLSHAAVDDGGLNSLGGRLSPEVASAVRPLPKWKLLRSALPEIAGNSVLDLGCNAGFFSFKFERMGARTVTGAEFMAPYYRQALWCKGQLGSNVEFVHQDFVLERGLEPHDVVFASEVLNHCLFPLYALARIVRLARKFVVIDTASRNVVCTINDTLPNMKMMSKTLP